MRVYTKDSSCRQFDAQNHEDLFSQESTQNYLRSQLSIQSDSIKAQIIEPLSQKLADSTQLCEERNLKITEMETEAKELNDQVANLSQEKAQVLSDSSKRFNDIRNLKGAIKEISQQNKDLDKRLTNLQTEYDKLQEINKISQHALNHSELQMLDNKIPGRSDNISKSSNFSMDLSETSHQELLRTLQLYRLPALNRLSVLNIHKYNKPEIINKFLLNGLQENIKEFTFNFSVASCLQVDEYMETFVKVVPRIHTFIKFRYCKLRKDQFETLLIASKNCKKVQFEDSMVETDEECDFGTSLDDSTFEILSFYDSGVSNKSNWKEDSFKKYKNIINGLAKVESVRNRPLELHLKGCEVSKDLAESILKDNGMDKVTVTGI